MILSVAGRPCLTVVTSVRSFHAFRANKCLLAINWPVVREPVRPLMRLVNYGRKKLRDIIYEPLRVVYEKDAVNRARHVLVYKGQRNLAVPALGILGLFLAGVAVRTSYGTFYSKAYLTDPDYDENSHHEEEVIFLVCAAVTYAILIGRFLNRYVIRMYYNEPKKMFTITTYNVLRPWTTQSRTVKAGSGRLLYESSKKEEEATWNLRGISSNCVIAGRKYLLHPENFKYPVYFNVLFGYDDPEAIAKIADSNMNADQIFRERAEDRSW